MVRFAVTSAGFTEKRQPERQGKTGVLVVDDAGSSSRRSMNVPMGRRATPGLASSLHGEQAPFPWNALEGMGAAGVKAKARARDEVLDG